MKNEENGEKSQQFIKLVRKAIDQDHELREKYEVGDKFRFVRERLRLMLESMEQEAQHHIEKTKKTSKDLLPDEMPVYVYLYNANGLILKSWLNMLTPKVFYEYSVNRPIYIEKSAVENFLRFKTNQNQHAYLTLAVKREDVLTQPNDQGLVKVKEGALKIEKLLSLTHNEQAYELSESGEMVKK